MVLTEVVNDGNIQYLNPDDEDEPGTQLYVTQEKMMNIMNRLRTTFVTFDAVVVYIFFVLHCCTFALFN